MAPRVPACLFRDHRDRLRRQAAARKRWFDLDDPALQQQVRREPRLVHFVAGTSNAATALKALRRLGIERGPLLTAERATPGGLLRWKISVRQDGQRLFYGGLPTLIQWGAVHPADSLPQTGLALRSLRVYHPRAADLRAAHIALGLQGVAVDEGPPNLVATFGTPKGLVTIESAVRDTMPLELNREPPQGRPEDLS